MSCLNGTEVGTLRAFKEPKRHLSGLNGTKIGTLRAFKEPEQRLSGLNGKYNGLSGARAAFEQKLNGPMVPQAGARDRMVPFDGTICGYKLFE